ncbi:MAG: FAD:protein FMN transferase [Steroidobacteraceae bacterium]
MPEGWIERAQPLLGTLVTIGVRGTDDTRAHFALDAAFAAVADVHRLMSFHEPASEVSRLNRDAARGAVRVDARTFEVLHLALGIAAATDGAFDISLAPQLVAQGLLPAPDGAAAPDPRASWRDIELIAPDAVAFHRALWIDLGGIAKGYAVDAAFAQLPGGPGVQRRVNAGGDLRVAGPAAERVLLKVPGLATPELPLVEIADGSIASSATGGAGAAHIDGRQRHPVAPDRFVSVVAERCVIADALTKVVLAMDAAAAGVLARHGAHAHVHSHESGWRTIGTA